MRILYISQYYPPATHGGAVCVNHILHELSKSNEILHFTAEPSGPIFKNVTTLFGHDVPAIFQHNLSYLLNIRKIIQYARKFRPHVILAQHQVDHLASLTAMGLGKLLKIPVVIRAEDIVNGDLPLSQLPIFVYCEFLNDLTLHFAKKASKFLVATSEIVDYLHIKRGFLKRKLGVSPNGVSLEMFKNVENPYEYDGDPVFVLMGSMAPADNVLLLVRSAPAILEEYPKSKFVFIGEGPEIEKAHNLSRALNVEKHFLFLGKVPHEHVPRYLISADIGIGPLRPTNENRMTVPLKILEYMAAKLPVISVQISKDVLRNNDTGIVINTASVEEFTKRILYLLDNKKIQENLSTRAYQNITKYDWRNIVKDLEKELMNVS